MQYRQTFGTPLFLALFLVSISAGALTLGIEDYIAFITSTEIATTDPAGTGNASLEDDRIGGPGANEFGSAGLDVVFTDNLNGDNLGTVTWEVTNNGAGPLTDVVFFGFLDADLGTAFDDEYGTFISVPGTGPGDSAPDTWEIDEPGFVFGDIFFNLLDGFLDETNGVPQGSEDDTSLALGFGIGTLGVGDTILATFTTSSDSSLGGLSQTDNPPPGQAPAGTFFFNATAQVIPAGSGPGVPAPPILLLFLSGLMGIALLHTHKSRAFWARGRARSLSDNGDRSECIGIPRTRRSCAAEGDKTSQATAGGCPATTADRGDRQIRRQPVHQHKQIH